MHSKNTSHQSKNISDLCDIKCFRSWKGLILFVFYAPFGFMLFIFRICFISVIICLSKLHILRKSTALCKFSLKVLGLHIVRNGAICDLAAYAEGCVVPSNHVSLLDMLLIIDMPHATVLVGNPIKDTNIMTRLMFSFIQCISSVKFWHVTDRRNFVRYISEWKKNPKGTTLYTTPEMTIGNGRGLFRFNTAFFCVGRPIVPSSILLSIPFGMAAHPLHSNGAAIFLRLLMMPWVRCDLTYLAKVEHANGNKEIVSKQVQQSIASHLGIFTTELTAADKYAFRKSTR